MERSLMLRRITSTSPDTFLPRLSMSTKTVVEYEKDSLKGKDAMIVKVALTAKDKGGVWGDLTTAVLIQGLKNTVCSGSKNWSTHWIWKVSLFE